MATPRVKTGRARKLHKGINKICAICAEVFYDNSPQKRTRQCCDSCYRKYLAGESSGAKVEARIMKGGENEKRPSCNHL